MHSNREEVLEVESQYYEKMRDEFKRLYPNRFLLIYKDELIGDFDTLDDAILAGIRHDFPDPFLARESGADEPQLANHSLFIM